MPPKKVRDKDKIESDSSDSSYSPPRTRQAAELGEKSATSTTVAVNQSGVEERDQQRNGVRRARKRRRRRQVKRQPPPPPPPGRQSRTSQKAILKYSSSSESEELEAEEPMASEPKDTSSKSKPPPSRRLTRTSQKAMEAVKSSSSSESEECERDNSEVDEPMESEPRDTSPKREPPTPSGRLTKTSQKAMEAVKSSSSSESEESERDNSEVDEPMESESRDTSPKREPLPPPPTARQSKVSQNAMVALKSSSSSESEESERDNSDVDEPMEAEPKETPSNSEPPPSGRQPKASQNAMANLNSSSSSESEESEDSDREDSEWERSEQDDTADESMRSELEEPAQTRRRPSRIVGRTSNGAAESENELPRNDVAVPANRAATPARDEESAQAAERARSHQINGLPRPQRLEDLVAGEHPRRPASIDSIQAANNSRFLEEDETASQIGLPHATSTPRPPRRPWLDFSFLKVMLAESSDEDTPRPPRPPTPPKWRVLNLHDKPRRGYRKLPHADGQHFDEVPVKLYIEKMKERRAQEKRDRQMVKHVADATARALREEKKRIRQCKSRFREDMKQQMQKQRREAKAAEKIIRERDARDAALTKQTIKRAKETIRQYNSDQKLAKMRQKQERAWEKNFNQNRMKLFAGRLSSFKRKSYFPAGVVNWTHRPRRSCTTLTPTTSANEPSEETETPRKRCPSESRFAGASELLPKTPITVSNVTAPYTEALNETLTELLSKPADVYDYGRRASELATSTDRDWSNISDPYYYVMKLRLDYVVQKISLNPTPDDFLDLDKNDLSRTTKHEWTAEFQSNTFSFLDSCIQSKEAFKEVALLKHAVKFQSLRDVPLVISAQYNKRETIAALRYLVEKFTIHFAIWKCKENGILPRVVQYFQFFIENTVGGIKKVNNGEHLEKIKELLFWLPIHLGDTRSKISAPRSCVMDLARQLARVILNDYPLLFASIRPEDAHALYRLEQSNLRIETLLGPTEDWMPYWRPYDRQGAFGRMARAEKKVSCGRAVRRRSHSFSEFTEVDAPFTRAQMAEAERIRNLPPLHNVILPNFYGLSI